MFKKLASLAIAATMLVGTFAISANAAEVADDNSVGAEESAAVSAEDSSEVGAEASSEVGAGNVIKFDVKNSGWNNVKSVFCHIWKADGTGTWPAWQSKKEKCDYDESTGIATYDLSKTGNDIKSSDGKIYCVIFSANTNMQTYDTIMSGACIGDTLTASTTEKYENPQDSAKSAIPAFWTNNKDCGPAKVVTSTGKVQGTALADGTSDLTIAADFFISYFADSDKMAKAQSVIDTLKVSPTAVMEVVANKEAAAVTAGTKKQDAVDKEMEAIEKILLGLTDPITGDKGNKDDFENSKNKGTESGQSGQSAADITNTGSSSSGSSSSGSSGSGSSSSGSSSSGSSSSSSSSSGSVKSGQETTIFLVLGSVMVAAMGVAFLARKKREN